MQDDKHSHCFNGKDLNPKTCSFSKSCKEGFVRDSDFKCVKGIDKIIYVKKINELISKIKNNEIRKSDATRILNLMRKDFEKEPSININNELNSLEEIIKNHYSETNAKRVGTKAKSIRVEETKRSQKVIEQREESKERKPRKETLKAMQNKLSDIKDRIINKKALRRSNVARQINVFKEKLQPENNLGEEVREVEKLLDEYYPMKNPGVKRISIHPNKTKKESAMDKIRGLKQQLHSFLNNKLDKQSKKESAMDKIRLLKQQFHSFLNNKKGPNKKSSKIPKKVAFVEEENNLYNTNDEAHKTKATIEKLKSRFGNKYTKLQEKPKTKRRTYTRKSKKSKKPSTGPTDHFEFDYESNENNHKKNFLKKFRGINEKKLFENEFGNDDINNLRSASPVAYNERHQTQKTKLTPSSLSSSNSLSSTASSGSLNNSLPSFYSSNSSSNSSNSSSASIGSLNNSSNSK
jgi:hypothetical protein